MIFQQANKFILNYLREKLGIPKEKVHMDITEIGNTVSSTIPIALKNVIRKLNTFQDDRIDLANEIIDGWITLNEACEKDDNLADEWKSFLVTMKMVQ